MSKFNLIEQSHEVVALDFDAIDKIALVAHNCYQVKEKTHEANINFVKQLIKNKHFAMLEHHVYCFKIIDETFKDTLLILNNHFINIYKDKISFSLRTAIELFTSEDSLSHKVGAILVKHLSQEIIDMVNSSYETNLTRDEKELLEVKDVTALPLDERKIHMYVSVKLITNRGVTHELVRHRLCAFAQESTRYCNYTKDKFSNALTYIRPVDYEEHKETYDRYFECEAETYFKLIEEKSVPDKARSVLCNSLKASIYVTCNLNEWDHIFELRTALNAHQDIRELLLPVKEELAKYNS